MTFRLPQPPIEPPPEREYVSRLEDCSAQDEDHYVEPESHLLTEDEGPEHNPERWDGLS